MKNPIGFKTKIRRKCINKKAIVAYKKARKPKKSIVHVYFPHRGMGWPYYNDSFDLKVGDFVYVEGKLEGYRGQVTEVNYSFKIKLSDYKKVIALIDTDVKGDFYLADSHVVSFDRNAIPFSKVINWFKAPENDEEYVIGNDDSIRFPLDDLEKKKNSNAEADEGYDYYLEEKVSFVEINGTYGHAIIEDRETYEIEFNYSKGEISNIKCLCYCSGTCKHEYAAMFQLRELLELITENYKNEFNGYFAAISKELFMNMVMNKKVSGKISLGGCNYGTF